MSTIIPLLEGTLSLDNATRMQAELDLANQVYVGDAPVVLSQILVNPSYAISLRQSAGYVLKKLVKEYWSSFFSSYKGETELAPPIKDQVRSIVLHGLGDENTKIRGVAAFLVTTIAHPDWPNHWPDLSDILFNLLQSPNPIEVDGAMRVVLDFVTIDLSEDQLLGMSNQLIPVLLRVASNEGYPALTRASAVHTFKQCVQSLASVKDTYTEKVTGIVTEHVPQWVRLAQMLIASGGELALRSAAFSMCDGLLQTFPSVLKGDIQALLAAACAELHAHAPEYRARYVLDDAPDADAEEYDASAARITNDVADFVFVLFEFVGQAARKRSTRPVFFVTDPSTGTAVANETFATLISDLVLYAEITAADEDNWDDNPDALVADEDDEDYSDSSRALVAELVASLVDFVSGPTTVVALWQAFVRFGNDSELASQPEAWRIYEAGLYLIGSVSADVAENAALVDTEALFARVVPQLLTTDAPYLLGRCFIFVSQFYKLLSPETTQQYIDASLATLQTASQPLSVQLSAVRALKNFFVHQRGTSQSALLFLHIIVPMLSQARDSVLALVVEGAEAAAPLCGELIDAPAARTLIDAVLQAWSLTITDPYVRLAVEELFMALAVSGPALQAGLLTHALPQLASLLSEHDVESPLVSGAALVIDAIMLRIPAEAVRAHPNTFSSFAPAFFKVLETTSDRETIQTSFSILTSIVRRDVGQLLAYDEGLTLTLRWIARCVEPPRGGLVSDITAESGGIYVGDLLLHLFRQAGSVLAPATLVGLTTALVQRLCSARMVSFTQSLLIPIAYLIHTFNTEEFLGVIDGVSVQFDGRQTTGLTVVFRRWTDLADALQGYWDNKISIEGLIAVFLSSYAPLDTIIVNGDLIPTADAKIKTRSYSKKHPDAYTQVPLRAKILKILIDEGHSIAKARTAVPVSQNADADSDDDSWADDDYGDNEVPPLEELLMSAAADMAQDKYEPDSEDVDLKEDPIYSLDMSSHLTQFFQHITAAGQLEPYVQYLSDKEKEDLQKLM